MKMLTQEQIREVFERFKKNNPSPKTELESHNTFTLLVSVVLSAQMTDKGVNIATKPLFAVADTPEKMYALGEEKLREYIKSINLYRNKAKYVIALSKILVDKYKGEVPGTREELESLPGVGRKSASVVLNVAFGKPEMPVDTHLLRITPRIGLSASTTPMGVEKDLLKIIPEEYLMNAHHWLILHGRYVCTAHSPKCGTCCISDICAKNL